MILKKALIVNSKRNMDNYAFREHTQDLVRIACSRYKIVPYSFPLMFEDVFWNETETEQNVRRKLEQAVLNDVDLVIVFIEDEMASDVESTIKYARAIGKPVKVVRMHKSDVLLGVVFAEDLFHKNFILEM